MFVHLNEGRRHSRRIEERTKSRADALWPNVVFGRENGGQRRWILIGKKLELCEGRPAEETELLSSAGSDAGRLCSLSPFPLSIDRAAMSGGEVFSPSSGCVLPLSAQALLWQVIGKLTKATEVVRYQHEATVSAAQKQAVLPPDVLVQKTVTVAFGDRSHTCVLWTGVGDFQIKKEAALLVAECLGLSRRAAKGRSINPAWVDPVTAFGMEAGMVSPFLPPRSLSDQRRTPIAALVVQLWPRGWEASKHVAISLSLYESLIIPLHSLRLLLRNYYAWRHPTVPCLFLPSDA